MKRCLKIDYMTSLLQKNIVVRHGDTSLYALFRFSVFSWPLEKKIRDVSNILSVIFFQLLVFFVKFVTITGQTSSASHAPRVSFVPGGTAGAQDVYS